MVPESKCPGLGTPKLGSTRVRCSGTGTNVNAKNGVTTEMAGAKWTNEETVALLNAYNSETVQNNIDSMSSNKELFNNIQRIMKEESHTERTVDQIKTKLKKLRSGYVKLKDRMKTSGSEHPYFSSALSSVEKMALKHWDLLDGILGKIALSQLYLKSLFFYQLYVVFENTENN